ncbi:MAG: transketolase family protein [Lachnospiraceae bacterium oral taxon 082]|nr:transketolase family protein [Lachnospiraceae bacterium oral taxon 082]
MNKIANRQAICDVLMEKAKNDKDIVVLCSDSRGSASLTPFANNYPEQFIEAGIAEQNLVGMAAGMALVGKKSFAVSPASFLSTRSYEQAKVDCAYSDTNVKLIGISGGVSYGALGMTHHSLQDIAAMSSIPNMRVYIPSDRFQTAKLVENLLLDKKTAYVRVGRNPVEDIYSENDCPFDMNKANVLKTGEDILIVACGEMVYQALEAAKILERDGVSVGVVDLFSIKPMDTQTILKEASSVKIVMTIEEHSYFGGMGSMVSQVIAENLQKKTVNIALPDEPVITGNSKEVFHYYKMDKDGIAERIRELLR